MVIGDLERFAIECEVRSVTDGGVFGSFRFWIRGHPVGDWDDIALLNACANWLDEFATTSVDRTAPELAGRTKEEIIRLLWDPVYPDWRNPAEPPAPADRDLTVAEIMELSRIANRHHLQHLGMSAFDQVAILLLEDDRQQRVVWRSNADWRVHEAILPASEMQRVAAAFLRWFKEQGYPFGRR